MRGTESHGRVLEAHDASYIVEFSSTEGRANWPMTRNQLDRDARHGCRPGLFTSFTMNQK